MPRSTFIITAVLLIASTTAVAAPFVNLNFEQAVVVKNEPTFGWLDWSLAVPGWGHSDGPDTQHVFYGAGHLGASQMYVLTDKQNPGGFEDFRFALEGRYSIMMMNAHSPPIQAFLSQTGDVPSAAKSVRMISLTPYPPKVSLGSVDIPMFEISSTLQFIEGLGNRYLYRYGGEVTAFAGSTTELKISVSPLDDITFSAQPIPEPSTVALAILSGPALLALRRRLR